ncbi:MAG: hypothetical protein CMN74_07200 [Sphingorhabdus sp.]|nr:hypothetical protein [Sphingorhabdus sp.]
MYIELTMKSIFKKLIFWQFFALVKILYLFEVFDASESSLQSCRSSRWRARCHYILTDGC